MDARFGGRSTVRQRLALPPSTAEPGATERKASAFQDPADDDDEALDLDYEPQNILVSSAPTSGGVQVASNGEEEAIGDEAEEGAGDLASVPSVGGGAELEIGGSSTQEDEGVEEAEHESAGALGDGASPDGEVAKEGDDGVFGAMGVMEPTDGGEETEEEQGLDKRMAAQRLEWQQKADKLKKKIKEKKKAASMDRKIARLEDELKLEVEMAIEEDFLERGPIEELVRKKRSVYGNGPVSAPANRNLSYIRALYRLHEQAEGAKNRYPPGFEAQTLFLQDASDIACKLAKDCGGTKILFINIYAFERETTLNDFLSQIAKYLLEFHFSLEWYHEKERLPAKGLRLHDERIRTLLNKLAMAIEPDRQRFVKDKEVYYRRFKHVYGQRHSGMAFLWGKAADHAEWLLRHEGEDYGF